MNPWQLAVQCWTLSRTLASSVIQAIRPPPSIRHGASGLKNSLATDTFAEQSKEYSCKVSPNHEDMARFHAALYIQVLQFLLAYCRLAHKTSAVAFKK